jgi:hypothetical protein
MELEGYKSAWQNRPVNGHAFPSPIRLSRSQQFLRTVTIRDWQRSEEISRFIFCLLFALLAVAVSIVVMTSAPARIGARMFATALLVDGCAGLALFARRLRQPATTTMMEFISRERSQADARVRLERYSQGLMIALAALALILLLFAPRPINVKENALDALQRMVMVTSFLLVAWRRAKSRSHEVRNELDRYLEDLGK